MDFLADVAECMCECCHFFFCEGACFSMYFVAVEPLVEP